MAKPKNNGLDIVKMSADKTVTEVLQSPTLAEQKQMLNHKAKKMVSMNIDTQLLKQIKTLCVEQDKTFTDFAVEALKEKLAQSK